MTEKEMADLIAEQSEHILALQDVVQNWYYFLAELDEWVDSTLLKAMLGKVEDEHGFLARWVNPMIHDDNSYG